MNKKLKNSIIIALIALPCIGIGVSVLNKPKTDKNVNNTQSIDTVEKNENSAEIIENENNEILPDDIADKNNSTNKENETSKDENEVDEDRNEVLENWNDTGAPMLIPIYVEGSEGNSQIIPIYNPELKMFGYCDKDTKEMVIEHKFANAGIFYSELAPVQLKKNGKVGFINMKGEVVKKPFIDYIHWVDTDKGVMVVQVANKYGALSLTGEIVLDIEYASPDEVEAKLGL